MYLKEQDYSAVNPNISLTQDTIMKYRAHTHNSYSEQQMKNKT